MDSKHPFSKYDWFPAINLKVAPLCKVFDVICNAVYENTISFKKEAKSDAVDEIYQKCYQKFI